MSRRIHPESGDRGRRLILRLKCRRRCLPQHRVEESCPLCPDPVSCRAFSETQAFVPDFIDGLVTDGGLEWA